MPLSRSRRALALVALAAGLALSAPATAGAGTVSVSGSTLTYTAAAGEANLLWLDKDPADLARLRLREQRMGASLTPGSNCSIAVDGVTCAASGAAATTR